MIPLFDAGAIQAHLDVELSEFDRHLTQAEERVKKFERERHVVKFEATLDAASMAKARQDFARLDQQLTRDATQRARGSQGSMLGMLTGLSGGGGTAGRAAGPAAGGGGGFLARLMGGIGPGITGIGARTATMIGAGGLGLGALPALAGGLAPLIPAAVGVGALGAAFSSATGPASQLVSAQQKAQQAMSAATTPAQKQAAQQQLASVNQQVSQLSPALKSIYNSETQIQSMWQKLTAGMAPMFAGALSSVAKLFQSLLPELRTFFASAGTMLQPLIAGVGDIARVALPLLSQAMRVAAPLLRPLLDGFAQLIKGLLPGLISLLKVAGPAVSVLANGLGILGKGLGGMLTAFAPVIKESSTILKSLFNVIGGLLPIIGQLAAIFAKALAPVIVEFSKVITALMPTLIIVGKLFASLAGAVLGDLASMLMTVAKVIIGIAPALAKFATALSGIFTVMENYGVFAALGNVVEKLAGPLAKLISLLLTQLTPLLPVLIQAISLLATVLINLTAAGLTGVIFAVTKLLTAFPFLVPLITAVYLGFKAWGVISPLVSGVMKVIDMLSLSMIKLGISVVIESAKAIAAFVAQAAAATATFIAENAATLGIIAGIALLVAAIIYLSTHWHQVWGEVKRLAKDAWDFLTHGWGQWLIPGLTAIRVAVAFVRDHWRGAWQDMKNIGHDFYQWLWADFGAKVVNFMTKTLPNAWSSAVDSIRRLWNKVEDVVKIPVKFVIDNVLDGLIRVFDTIINAVGLGSAKIPEVHPFGLAAGGKITQGSGPTADDVLIRASRDETVVSAADSRTLAPLFAMMGIPGYAAGGKVGQPAPLSAAQARFGTSVNPSGGSGGLPGGGVLHNISHAIGQGASIVGKAASKIIDAGKMAVAFATGNAQAFTNAFASMLGLGTGGGAAVVGKILTQMPKMIASDLVAWIMGKSAAGQATGSGADIANYAASFLGKIPYVWGGTSVPGGADCSGFVQAIYHHFGINAPRTSEAQGAWVTRAGPQAGGLAFYHSPAGGADPGHVAIVRNANQVISQGGGMGPQLMALHGMPLLWTGVPSGGFGGSGGVGGLIANASVIGPYLLAHGASKIAAAGIMGNMLQESGGNWNAPGGGLIQIISAPQPQSLAQSLAQTIAYINANGGMGPINSAGDVASATRFFMDVYERPAPATANLARRLAGANAAFAAGYADGGVIKEPIIGFGASGQTYTFGENGMEYVTPAGPGGSPPGAMIGNVHIQLPEGHTIARALSELTFWLKVAQQQGYAGVLPGG